MPLYEYKCPEGHTFTRFLPLASYREEQICEYCQKPAEKQLSAPAVLGDYPGYSCPITGTWIEGRRAHEENLRKHGCRVLESGETKQAQASAQRAEEILSDKIAETAEALVEQMPSAKREQLGRELSNGADVTVIRQ